MKAVFAILSVVGLAAAQFPGAPQCAVNCLLPAIPATGCQASDIPCLCAHKDQLTNAIIGCVINTCSSAEIQATLAAVSAACGN
ncbi:hypothetical protein PT974_07047 [Cladobotryum mycophilum]|uniref:CFEM domain-containing protein n=1 Tax=Cladobotryum mycophilum TaxID=491253 RepID=A0ABR0SN49_9HYPO